jgi:hypothetical protein
VERTRNEEADCPGIDVQRGERFRKACVALACI